MIRGVEFLLFFSYCIFFHNLVLTKFLDYRELDKRIESLALRKVRLVKEKEVVLQEYKSISKELENIPVSRSEGFSSRGSFEKFVNRYLQYNFLHLESIGRIEEDGGMQYTFPYEISGELHDIFNFIKDLEQAKEEVYFTRSPFAITNGKRASIQLKLSAKIVDCNQKESNCNEMTIHSLAPKEIKIIKFFTLDSKNYIIVRYIDNSLLVLGEDEEITTPEGRYRVKIDGKNILLKKIGDIDG